MGFKAEVEVNGQWGQNAVIWPDRTSAEQASLDLYTRWTLTTAHRAVEVDEEPNRPTWDEWVAARGLPPRSAIITNIVGRCHVGDSDRTVVDLVLSKLVKGEWEAYTPEHQARIVWTAISAHHVNQLLYASVMRGGR